MYKINFNQPLHIHFIGIGGISMSGLAEILLEEHFAISGSDAKESELTRHLEHMGARIFTVRRLKILPTALILSSTPLPSGKTIRNMRPQRSAASQC